MVEIDRLLREIDKLSPADLEVVYRHIMQRFQPGPRDHSKTTQTMMQPVYGQSASMSGEEIEAVIQVTLDEERNNEPDN